jgi:hypothetical protein
MMERDGRAHLEPYIDAIAAGASVPSWTRLHATAAEFLETCARAGLAELVHHAIARAGGPEGADWPAEVRRRLAAVAQASAAVEIVRARELAGVLQATAARGVEPILLKGTALAYTVYPVPGCRPRVDTDLLVPRDRLATVRAILADRGYSEARLTPGELVFGQFEASKTDALGVEHVMDVHWKISTQPVFADLLGYGELSAAAIPVPALGPAARAPARAHALLLACVHPVMHHRNAARPIWIHDVHRLVSSCAGAELQTFAELACAKRVAAICARQLAAARGRFGTPVPGWLTAALTGRSFEPSAAYLKPGRRWHHELVSSLGCLGWRGRVRLLREVVLPRPRYMLGAYGVGRSGVVLLPALYAHRAAYGAWKILAGRK